MTALPGMFTPFARLIHWLMAVLVIAMLYVGVGMVASLAHRDALLAWHRPIGISLLLLVVVRLLYRLRHPPPALPASVPRWQQRAAHASHLLLYALLLTMPLIGWGMLSAGGYPIVFAGDWVLPPILPQNVALYSGLRIAHGVLGYLLFATILLHLAAALSHAWLRGDGVFSSMTWRRRAPAGADASEIDAGDVSARKADASEADAGPVHAQETTSPAQPPSPAPTSESAGNETTAGARPV